MGWVATTRGLAVVAYLAVLTTAVAYLTYARGLRTIVVTTATTLGLAEPAVAAVLGLTLLREHQTATGLVGLGILAVSLAILAWPARRLTPGNAGPRCDAEQAPGGLGGPPEARPAAPNLRSRAPSPAPSR